MPASSDPGAAAAPGGDATPGARFSSLLAGSGLLILPGVHDALSARLAQRAGHPAVYLSGSAVAMSLLGLPDVGLVSMTEVADQARRVVDAVSIPVICDADTGYGNALNVDRAVRLLERAGVAGIQLEDQDFPKRCGHFDRKTVIPKGEMAMKLQAALEARHDPSLVLIARTDARAGHGLEAAIERALAYREAGADVIFVEAPESVDELAEIGRRVPGPLLVNVVDGGRTPQLEANEYAALGFAIVLYPTTAVRVAARAVGDFYRHLLERGTSRQLPGGFASFEERNTINDLEHYEELERRYTPPRDDA